MRARSLTISYATNRAAWSCIAGMKEDFPFQWQQEENVIGEAARCIFTVFAADQMLNGSQPGKNNAEP